MGKGTKDILWTCSIAFILMLAFPAAFRVWMVYHPQPPPPVLAGGPFDLAAIRMEQAKKLLSKPLAKWTDSDRAAEPAIAEWLTAHGKVVLPWEWSEVARVKDAAGYRKAWRKLVADECTCLEDVCEGIRKQKKTLNATADRSRILYSHVTNELARLASICATNAYPSSVEKVVLSKGRLWGWNRKQERVELPDAKSAAALLDSLRSDAAGLMKAIHGNEQSLQILARHEERFVQLSGNMEKMRSNLQKKEQHQLSELQNDVLDAIVSDIHACATWRKSASQAGF